MKCCSLFPLSAMVIFLVNSCTGLSSDPSDDRLEVDFVREVKPILSNQCLPCHHSQTQFGGFNLETEKKALRMGRNGPFIDPGFPEGSRLWQLVTEPHPDKTGEDRMPAHGPRLSEDEKRVLFRWIEQGATWPSEEAGRLRPIQEPRSEA